MRYFLGLISLFFFGLQLSFAQYTEIINSRRPGFSDSPYSVGTGVYQIEGGLYYNKIGNKLEYNFQPDGSFIPYNYSSKAFGSDIFLRAGFLFERLEFNLDMNVQNENRTFTQPTDSTSQAFGFSKMTFGAKYMVYSPTYTDKTKEIRSWKARHSYDWRRLIPAVGVYAGLNTNLLDHMHKNQDGLSPRFALFTQNDITDRLIVVMNFIYDRAFTEMAFGSYILTATYAITPQISAFGETQMFFQFQDGVPNDIQFGLGGAYLFNRNMQFDLSGRMILDERGDNTYLFNAGVSWRIDRHHDKVIKKKNVENTGPGLEIPDDRSFFDKITFGLFSGNKAKSTGARRPDKVKPVKAKKRDLTPPVNKKARRAQKKRNKQLIKQERRKEKAQRKYNKKKEKSADNG